MKKKTALLIMAAGIGSRFGAGVKQLTPVGPSGELLIDYSIHDALAAGFDKVVFVIRRDIEADFRQVIGDRIAAFADVYYAFQELGDLPEGFSVPEGRKKPWGTGQAVLAAAGVIDCPFIVINADDFYGAGGFLRVHEHLVSEESVKNGRLNMCMAGYVLGNTLSLNGTVTRGICRVDGQHDLISVTETYDIAMRDGAVRGTDQEGRELLLSASDLVSMNMWGFPTEIMGVLKDGFVSFLSALRKDDLKAEYLLPGVVDGLIREGRGSVRVLPVEDRWYGMTHGDDRAYVADAIRAMVDKGIYKEKLFG